MHRIAALPQLVGERWLARADAPVRPADRAELGRMAGTSDHQGVVAEAGPYPYARASLLLREDGPLVCLDGAQDPRNIGAVARVAEAGGAAGLVIPGRGSPGVTAVVCKASAGAVEHLLVSRTDGLIGLLHDARGMGRTVAGADADAPGVIDHAAAGLPMDTVLVLGAEGSGLRPRVRDACDVLVGIPMRGRVASLNLSVAAGILLFGLPRPSGPQR